MKLLTIPKISNSPRRKAIRKITNASALVIIIITSSVALMAQTFRGSILGTVTDPNGAVVPDATV
ncbi:MAG: hypothetical protein C5B44_00140, partial [Acidobacteria bacterium]